jgi:hypothetical protein
VGDTKNCLKNLEKANKAGFNNKKMVLQDTAFSAVVNMERCQLMLKAIK